MENGEQSGTKTHESGVVYKEYTLDDKLIRVFASDSSKRLEFETYEEYRFRRDVNNYLAKIRKRGVTFWPSVIQLQNGMFVGNTYNKERAEKIREQVINKQKEEKNG